MKPAKIVLITGASSGIGKAIAKELSIHGYEVILTARNKEKLVKVSEEIKELGHTTHIIPCDISDENQVQNLFQESLKIGFVSSIINNAGFGKFSSIHNVKIEDWDNQINTNLRGAFLVTQKFVSNMMEKKEGNILFINSVAGKYGYPYSAAYVASKFGLKGFADSIRNELREYNIKVISIHPGAINTNFWDNLDSKFNKDDMLNPNSIAKYAFQAINSDDDDVVEEIVIRRTAGDF